MSREQQLLLFQVLAEEGGLLRLVVRESGLDPRYLHDLLDEVSS